jgi:hypothetical protein
VLIKLTIMNLLKFTFKILIIAGFFIFVLSSKRCYAPCFDYKKMICSIERSSEMEKIKREIVKYRKIFFISQTIATMEGGSNYDTVGSSGEHGKYQFMSGTWKRECMSFFGVILEKTPENQDLIAFKYIKSLIDKRYSIRQIASIWNSGRPNSTAEGINKWGVPYSVPKYVNKFLASYNKIIKSAEEAEVMAYTLKHLEMDGTKMGILASKESKSIVKNVDKYNVALILTKNIKPYDVNGIACSYHEPGQCFGIGGRRVDRIA